MIKLKPGSFSAQPWLFIIAAEIKSDAKLIRSKREFKIFPASTQIQGLSFEFSSEFHTVFFWQLWRPKDHRLIKPRLNKTT